MIRVQYLKLPGIILNYTVLNSNWEITYEEHVLDPLYLIEHNEEEGKEEVSKCKEHKKIILIHGPSEWMANTEWDACNYHLEHWDLEQYGVDITWPAACSIFSIKLLSNIVRVIFETEK